MCMGAAPSSRLILRIATSLVFARRRGPSLAGVGVEKGFAPARGRGGGEGEEGKIVCARAVCKRPLTFRHPAAAVKQIPRHLVLPRSMPGK